MIVWTREKIAEKSDSEIKSLRDNVAKLGRHDIAELCNEVLASRKPARTRSVVVSIKEDRSGHYVSEFHFVCPNELGVIRNQDGTIWTGTWVVAEKHAQIATKYGSVVALHSSKADTSYLQGVIKDWRKSSRERHYSGEQLTQTEEASISYFNRWIRRLFGKAKGPERRGMSGRLSLNRHFTPTQSSPAAWTSRHRPRG